ncbi:MAG: TetR/AcrR family transcriptional regulator [Synechococcales bacterium]|nr:TetR/AcrR family transcriptional regulator [Synechococcales bacterium]
MDVAQEMVRSRGYSAFSYADISKQVGIRKASIHYHFPSKDDLARELVKRYRQGMARQCDLISQSGASPKEQLRQFADLYRQGLEAGQICLCAMLAADLAVLPETVQAEVRLFFQQTEAWLAELLKRGCETGAWDCTSADAKVLEAKGLIALLQGAQLIARSEADCSQAFERIVYPMLPR